MLDIGWTELLVVGLVLILVVGPKDLPRVIRTMGQWTARARRVAREFQDSLDDIARDSEIEEMRKQFNDPGGIRGQVENAIDPGNALREAVDTDYAGNQLDSSGGLAEDPEGNVKIDEGATAKKDQDRDLGKISDIQSESDESTSLTDKNVNGLDKQSGVSVHKEENKESKRD